MLSKYFQSQLERDVRRHVHSHPRHLGLRVWSDVEILLYFRQSDPEPRQDQRPLAVRRTRHYKIHMYLLDEESWLDR